MPPQTIGSYQIRGELGRGAMGVVYHGFDPAIGRPVAIKVIRIDPGATAEEGTELRQRLIREASAAGKLSHPGIVTIHQLGEEGQDVYVVMEYVQGTSLQQWASNRGLDHAHTLEILRQIAEALDYAHRCGVVHRDIKPANIMIRDDGCVKVADFGLAKMVQDHTRSLTAVGVSLGSPAYMSPEQVRAQQIDGRSDQFSLGVVAYQLLTGKLPFTGDTAHAVMFQIVSTDPVPVHDVSNLPPAMATALSRALAKNAADRYPNCAAFVRELASAQAATAAAADAPTVRVASLAAAAPASTQSMPPPAPAAEPQPAASVAAAPVVQTAAAPTRSYLIPVLGLLLLLLLAGGYFAMKKSGTGASGTAAAGATAVKPPNPLLQAIDEGRGDDVKALLAKGADPNAADQNGATALMKAADGAGFGANSAPIVTLLLDKGATVDAQDNRGWAALYFAVAAGRLDAVKILLAHKANPNLKARDGSTSLAGAIERQQLDILRALLDGGGDVENADINGTRPLMLAAETGGNNTPFVQLLLDKGAKVDPQDGRGRIALHRAVSEGKIDAARLLLDKKSNINAQESNGATPLIDAVTYGRQEIMQLLLERGADAGLADASGSTALAVAAEGTGYMPNNAPFVSALIAAKAKIDAQDQRGRSPLYRAAAEGKEDAVRLLLDKKADINLRATDGSSPILMAVTQGKLNTMLLLLDRGADVNLADASGTTPLMAAADSPYIKTRADFLTPLLAHGAKKDAKDERGRTALDRATEAKSADAVALLQKK